MTANVRQMVVPAYLFLCLLLGGSAQGIWGNMLLQFLGVAIIAWAVAAPAEQPLLKPARQLLILALAAIAISALQIVPLPPSVWTNLGPREPIAQGYRILGLALPALPVSLTPHRTIDSLLSAIPPLAVFLGVVRLKAFRAAFAAAAIIAGAVAGTALSALQVSSAQSATSPWYLYPVTSVGFGVGFFANVNHMASLLLISLPFIAALAAAARGANVQRYTAFLAVTASLAILIMLGIGLNGSFAGYGLVLPVAVASLLVVVRVGRRGFGALIGLSLLLMAGALAFIAITEVGRDRFGVGAAESTGSRIERLGPTLEIARDYFPLGTGLGSFRQVYAMHEDPDQVGATYVNHAHNDYAEWVMETGLPGLLIMILFLAWWARAAVGVWRNAESGAFAKAASIASAAVLAHSLVDFPLRTSAIAACFALCLALLADRRSPQAAKPGDLRPTRHVIIR
jgi:O-antigen ligase